MLLSIGLYSSAYVGLSCMRVNIAAAENVLRYTFECFIYMLYYTIYIIRFMAVQRLATSNNYNN